MQPLSRIFRGLRSYAGNKFWVVVLAVVWVMCFKLAVDWYRSNDWLGVVLAVGVIVLLPIIACTQGNERISVTIQPDDDETM